MKWNDVEESWNEVRGEFKKQFNKLTDQDLKKVGGKRRELEKMIQDKYKIGKSEAKQRVDDFIEGMKQPKQKN